MNKLILFRHGDYDSCSKQQGLTENGRESIADLAKVILDHTVDEEKILIASSRFTADIQSAEIVAMELDLDPKLVKQLVFLGEPSSKNFALTDQLLEENNDGIVIAAANYKFVGLYPKYVKRNLWNLDDPETRSVGYSDFLRPGEGYVLDGSNQSTSCLSHQDGDIWRSAG